MILGDRPEPCEVGAETIRVRCLTLEEVHGLSPSELIFVQDPDSTSGLLTPAHPKAEKGNVYLEGTPPRLHVRSIYGSEFWVSAEEGVFEEDDLGEEMPVVRTAGVRISSSVFIGGDISPAEAEQRLKRALRNEFGPGVVEVWNLRSGPVRDLFWDVYEVRSAWVPHEKGAKGKGEKGSFREVERRLLAQRVRDGHHHYFMGKETPGWQLLVTPHQPPVSHVEVL